VQLHKILAAVVLVALCACQQESSLVGIWADANKSEDQIEFLSDGKCVKPSGISYAHGCWWRDLGNGDVAIWVSPQPQFRARHDGESLTVQDQRNPEQITLLRRAHP
jgi:hypothetical protein